MSVGLVVDTSVWIDFFGGRTIPLLEDALAIGSVVLPPVVVAELVSGARQPSDRDALVDLWRIWRSTKLPATTGSGSASSAGV